MRLRADMGSVEDAANHALDERAAQPGADGQRQVEPEADPIGLLEGCGGKPLEEALVGQQVRERGLGSKLRHPACPTKFRIITNCSVLLSLRTRQVFTRLPSYCI